MTWFWLKHSDMFWINQMVPVYQQVGKIKVFLLCVRINGHPTNYVRLAGFRLEEVRSLHGFCRAVILQQHGKE